jgi:hypothetical protein
MARPKLEIIAGAVVDVQLSERRVEDVAPDPRRRGRRRKKPAAIITGRLRLFLDGPGLNDPHYDFDRCELAVRRDQVVAFARVVPDKRAAPVNMMLLNQSAGTTCEFPNGFAAYLGEPVFGAKWKAVGLSTMMFIIGHLLSRFVISPNEPGRWFWFPLMFAFLSYVVFWGAMIVYENWSYRERWAKLRQSLRARLEAAKAPPPEGAAPAAGSATPAASAPAVGSAAGPTPAAGST